MQDVPLTKLHANAFVTLDADFPQAATALERLTSIEVMVREQIPQPSA